MPRFHAYGLPFQYYKPYNYLPRTPFTEPFSTAQEINHKKQPELSKRIESSAPVWFELFGIKLYFDDVLILSLLFFLYKEEVKDEGLFFALVMLLIS